MEAVIQCAGIAVIAAVFSLLLKQSGGAFSVLLSLAAVLIILGLTVTMLRPVLDFTETLKSAAGVSGSMLEPVFKCLGIARITEIAGWICQDAGENGTASALRTAGTFAALYVSLPLLQNVLELTGDILSS